MNPSPFFFQPYRGLLTRGYQSSPHWVRLSIDPSLATTSQPHILRIQPQYLDYITLFDPLEPSQHVRQTGGMTRLSVDEYQSLNFNFVIPVGDQPRYLYLKIETRSTTLLAAQVLPPSQVLRQDRLYEVFASLLLGVLFLIVIWALFQWLLEPSLLMASFLVKQLAVMSHAAGYMGYWRLWLSDYLPPALLNELFSLNIFIMTAAAIWFVYQFLKEYDPQPWAIRLFAGCLLFFPVQVILQWSGYTQMALETVALLSLFMPMLGLYLAATARVWKTSSEEDLPVLSRNQLTLLFLLLAIVLWIYVLPVLGLIRVEPLTLYGIMLYNLVTSLMMMAALQLRARHRSRQQAKIQERLLMVEREVRIERERREEQKRFMDMLTHELKNPLSTIRLVTYGETEYASKVSAAIADMQSIIDRCAQLGQIEAEYVIPRTDTIDLKEIVRNCQERL
ncbi:7TM-DISM domain-containing protein [Ectothiorhodosinus mongolicus]|uniref:7TM-DISM domain-containing protein n=1 Tax=Ectothiorhodosinus mongolicus TaxID=233100 RepID=UPI0030B81773